MMSMTQRMMSRRVDGMGNPIVPDFPSVDSLMAIGNPQDGQHLMNSIHSAYNGKDRVEDMMHAMNEQHGGAWYDDIQTGLKNVGSFLWNNKDDIMKVAQMVAPLFGAGMDFDDAYDTVVGGAASRFLRTMPELKHYNLTRLLGYAKSINKLNKAGQLISDDNPHILGVRKIKVMRQEQQKRNPDLFKKNDAKRKTYSKQHFPSRKIFREVDKDNYYLPREPSRIIEASVMTNPDEDIGKVNDKHFKALQESLSEAEFNKLIKKVKVAHDGSKNKLGFNKAVKAILIDEGVKFKSKPKKSTVKGVAPDD